MGIVRGLLLWQTLLMFAESAPYPSVNAPFRKHEDSWVEATMPEDEFTQTSDRLTVHVWATTHEHNRFE